MATPEKITCRACGTEFASRDALERHNQREHGHQSQPRSPLSTETSSPRREDRVAGSEPVE